jgi:hypothetical protein
VSRPGFPFALYEDRADATAAMSCRLNRRSRNDLRVIARADLTGGGRSMFADFCETTRMNTANQLNKRELMDIR